MRTPRPARSFSLFVLSVAYFSLQFSPLLAQDINDEFARAEFDARVAERGDWKFENGIASCESDEELYKKYKNHGPIIKWPWENGFTDCITEFEMKQTDCQRVVFTFNGDGHVFRVSLVDPSKTKNRGVAKSRLIAWASKSSKENKGDSFSPKGIPSLPDINNKWVKVKATVSDGSIDFSIGGFTTTLKHAALSRTKNMTMLTFAKGSFEVRNFQFTASSTQTSSEGKDIKHFEPTDFQPIQRLPEELRKQTKTLNPDYAVFAPTKKFTGKIPLMIILHGGGGNGDDIKRTQKQTSFLVRRVRQKNDQNCFFVAPQCSRGQKPELGIWRADDLNVLLANLKKTLPIDESRIYLTGASMGGYGSWAWAAANPEQFAAVAPVCGGLGPGGPRDVTKELDQWAKSLTRVPIWTFHGEDDKVVPFANTKKIVEMIKQHGGKTIKFTTYPGVGHNSAKPAYDDPELFKWMFKHSLKGTN